VLFSAASLQQVGLLYTTAAKAGFITGLYIILVPVIGLALRHKTGANTWVGALIAMAGLYYSASPRSSPSATAICCK
jgi:drug/metabolite transporter (DMT)-like permease